MVIGTVSGFVLGCHFIMFTHCYLGSVAQVIGYALEAPAPPFPVFVLGYAINGFGLALQVGLFVW